VRSPKASRSRSRREDPTRASEPEADRAAAALGAQLANGWKRYFAWEITFVAVGALLLLGMIAGWRRHLWSWKKTLVTVLGGLLVVEAVNVGLIMLTATTA